MLCVHHDLQTVKEYFDYVMIMNTKIIVSGDVNEVFTEENLSKAYKNTHNILKV